LRIEQNVTLEVTWHNRSFAHDYRSGHHLWVPSVRGSQRPKKPSDFEYAIANWALAVSIPSASKALKNPIHGAPAELADAKEHYKEHCAVCHAENGSGKTETAAGMSPEVPDLRAKHIQKLTDGELFYVIKNGVR